MYLVSAMRLPLVRSMCSLAQESDKQRKTPLKYLIEICAFYILAWAWPRWWNRRSYDCKRHLLDPVGGQIGSFYLKCPVRSPSPCLVFLVFTLPPARPHLCPLRHYTGSVSSYYINDHSELRLDFDPGHGDGEERERMGSATIHYGWTNRLKTDDSCTRLQAHRVRHKVLSVLMESLGTSLFYPFRKITWILYTLKVFHWFTIQILPPPHPQSFLNQVSTVQPSSVFSPQVLFQHLFMHSEKNWICWITLPLTACIKCVIQVCFVFFPGSNSSRARPKSS